MRRRPAAFVSLLVVSALAVAVSELTPMLLRAVQADALERAVAGASTYDRSIAAVAQATDGAPIGDAVYAAQQVVSAHGGTRLWGDETDVITTPGPQAWNLEGRGGADLRSYFTVTLDPRCPGLTIVSGRCPAGGSEVLMPRPTAQRLGVRVGQSVTIGRDGPNARVLEVVGTYDDTTGYGRVLAAPDALVGVPLVESSGSLLLGTDHVEQLKLDFEAISAIALRTPLALGDVAEVRSDVTTMQDGADDYDAAAGATEVRTGLTALLDRVGDQQSAAAVLTTATALEALALSWFALAHLIQRISRVRAVEWGIGRTRGVKRRSWAATVFLEPAVAVVLGALLGLPLALGVARLAVTLALGSSVPLEPARPPVVAAAGLAVAGSLVALVAASLRSARLPLPALLRETTEPRRLSRFALVAQAGVVLVTATVLWAVLTQPQISGPQVALLTPSLVALVVGIGALRFGVVLVRRATARPPRSLTGLVVGRQLARAPSSLTGAVLVAVGLALAAYLVALSLVTMRLQSDRAAADVGATTVLQVETPQDASIVDLVRRADPSGRAAMAAVQTEAAASTGTNRIVAVDSSRLAAVTTWRSAWWGGQPAAVLRGLDPPTSGTLTFRGSRLELTLGRIGDGSPDPAATDGSVRLSAEIGTSSGWMDVDLGLLHQGVLRSPMLPCDDGCRLVSLSVQDPNSTTTGPFGVSFDLLSIATDRQPASVLAPWLTSAHSWRQRIADQVDPTHPEYAQATPRGDRVELEFDANTGGVSPTVEPVSGPAVLPAVVAAGTGAGAFPGRPDTVFGSDLGGDDLLLQVVSTPAVLPRFGGQGVLVDIGQLGLLSDVVDRGAVDEVWLAPGDHAGVLAALRNAGVRVTGTQSFSALRADYAHEAPVQALELTAVTAAAALLLTLVALGGARAVGGASRRRDDATLRVAGVRSRVLGRMTALELAVPTAAGAVLGVVAGVLAYALTVARLPLLAGDGAGPPPDLLPPVGALLLLLAGGVVVAALLGLAAARGDRGAGA